VWLEFGDRSVKLQGSNKKRQVGAVFGLTVTMWEFLNNKEEYL
jgi:hypothetical protein